MAVSMFAGRPLRDAENLGGLGDVLMSISVPQPIRSWLIRALHMDPRRVFVHAGEASQALTEAMGEAGLRPSPRDLDLQQSRSSKLAAPTAVSSRPITVAPPKAVTLPKPAARAPRRDAWEAHDVDRHVHVPQRETFAIPRIPMSATVKRFLFAAAIIGMMFGAFTVAQFIPVPEWMFADTGILVVESSPQGVKVLVNGQPQGVTPLTLKVESGLHEVELHGPGRPKIFKVHVTRGDRVAQYIEFPRPPDAAANLHIIEGSRWLSSDPSVLFVPIRPPRRMLRPFPTTSSTSRKRARWRAAAL